jgi:WD40 repeat protein
MLVWQAHRSRIRSLAFSPDGRLIATTAGKSKHVWLWDASTGRIVRKLSKGENSTRLAAFHPDGRHVVGLFDARGGCVWETATGRAVSELETEHWQYSDTMAVSPIDGRVLVHVTHGLAEWVDVTKPTEQPRRQLGTRRLPRHILYYPLRLAYSPSGRFLCFLERNLTLADPVSHRTLHTLVDPRGANASAVAFDTDESRIAVAFGHRGAIWRMDQLHIPPVLLCGHALLVRAIGFLPDGDGVLTAGMDGTARTWDASTGAERRAFDWGIGKIRVADISPDGLTCAAGGDGGQIVVWDVDA